MRNHVNRVHGDDFATTTYKESGLRENSLFTTSVHLYGLIVNVKSLLKSEKTLPRDPPAHTSGCAEGAHRSYCRLICNRRPGLRLACVLPEMKEDAELLDPSI
jgi:hypothetical protein